MRHITITRDKKQGTLSYSNADSVKVQTACWWDPDKKIPPGEYKNCSATTMSSKKNSQGQPREAIFIPGVEGFSGIFIHMGNDPSWSDGCVVVKENRLLDIYNDIDIKDGENITVSIQDAPPQEKSREENDEA